jgi:hypothetical protein
MAHGSLLRVLPVLEGMPNLPTAYDKKNPLLAKDPLPSPGTLLQIVAYRSSS